MPTKDAQRLVIDACVARAAGGEDAKHPVSRDCRDFLHEMLRLSHTFVRTNEIWAEWNKHKSTYAKLWLSTMIAKKRVYKVELSGDVELRQFASCQLGPKEAEAMLKDCHLVEAAKATDHVVVSKEKVARQLFSKASVSLGWLRTVAWVNPADSSETPIEWLKNGAIPDKERCLSPTTRKPPNSLDSLLKIHKSHLIKPR